MVAWFHDGWNDEECWMCGGPGELEGKFFAGDAVAFVDQPPRSMWKQLGWSPPEEVA
jgi:hypothetical protein